MWQAPGVMTLRPLSRRLLLRAALGTAALHAPLAALAGFNFFTSEYTASREELQAQVAKRFPVRQRYAELFTVALREPRLTLDATTNRAAIAALVTIGSPLLSPPSVEGVIMVSSALKYDPAALAIRLDQPKAERLELQGMTGRDAERLQQIGAVVAQELLRDYALIAFKPEQLTVGRKTYQIGQITVEPDDIRVELK
ncbi:MAG: putative transrane protein [Variovorax sp.]|nr:putative transrane protein [Variovorax sp.]